MASQYACFKGVKYLFGNLAGVDPTSTKKRNESMFEIVKYLVDNGADVNAKGEYGSTYATEFGHFKNRNYLVEKGDKKSDITALMYASENGHLEMVTFLVENGADVNAKDEDKNTALMLASEKLHLEILRCVLDDHSLDETNILAPGRVHFEIVKYLVEHGADLNAKDDKNDTALKKYIDLFFEEIKFHNFYDSILELTVSDNSIIYIIDTLDEENSFIESPSIETVANRFLEIVKYFLENGADFQLADKNKALISASEQGYFKIVKYLVENEADLNKKDKIKALIVASREGHFKIFKYLIENFTDASHSEIVKYFVENGANVTADDENGKTSIILPGKNCSCEIAINLVENTADVKARNKRDDTLSKIALLNANLEIFKYLFENGADVKDKDDNFKDKGETLSFTL